MANQLDNGPWIETPLFGDDMLRAEARFSDNCGWEWTITHRDEAGWHLLDSGLAGTWEGALHQLQRTIGEISG